MNDGKSYGSKPLGFVLTLCGGLLWAVGASCGQQLFQVHDVTSNWLIPIRILLSGLVLLLYSFIKYPVKDVLSVWKTPKDARDLLLFSLFGATASQYTYYTCIQYSNAAFATVISYMFPVVILIYGFIRFRKAPKLYELLSVILVTVGAFTCTTHWNLGDLSVPPIAIIIGLLCAVTSAYNTVKPQRLLRTYALVSIVGWSMTIGGLVLCIALRPWTIPVTITPTLLLLMATIILGGTIFAFSFFQAGVRIVGSLAGSILASVEPVGAIVIAALFLKVPFTPEDFIGFLLILATIPIIAFGQHREVKRMEPVMEELAKPETQPSESAAGIEP